MKEFFIYRLPEAPEGTFGAMTDERTPFCVTLELPWKDNQTDISCIPALTYTCERVKSPKFGNTFEIKNVPNRTKVLFHIANLLRNLKGCIGLGEMFDPVYGINGIAASGKAFKEFMQRTKGLNEFLLHIKEVSYGGD